MTNQEPTKKRVWPKGTRTKAIDWPKLIRAALADPVTQMDDLAKRFLEWAHAFEHAHDHTPKQDDFPVALDRFLRQMAISDISPELLTWIDAYESKNGRPPKYSELPEELQRLAPKSDKPSGRPRCDAQKTLIAAREWELAQARVTHDYWHTVIRNTREIMEKTGMRFQCDAWGFDETTFLNTPPSALAIEKVAEALGVSPQTAMKKVYSRKKA